MRRCRCSRRFGECRAFASAIRIRLAVMPDYWGTSIGALRRLTTDQTQCLLTVVSTDRAAQIHQGRGPGVLNASEPKAFELC